MVAVDSDLCRLCLVTPPRVRPAEFAPILEAALSGGDVASLIITGDPHALEALARAAVPVAQNHGVAALVHNDTRIAGHVRADGVHIDASDVDFAATVAAQRPKNIVGIGDLRSRHTAMLAGEADPDYVFFGRLDGDTDATIHPKALELATWWAEIFQVPAVVMGGSTLDSVIQARDAGIEFVALNRAVWEHPAGPAAAVAEANRLLGMATETTS